MRDRNPELIDWSNPVHYTAPNVRRVHLGIRAHASCVHAQISGHVIKENKVKIYLIQAIFDIIFNIKARCGGWSVVNFINSFPV